MSHSEVKVKLVLDTSAFVAAMRRTAAAALARFSQHVALDRRGRLRRVDRDHPQPLSIDGAAYRRRCQARRRRIR